MGAEPFPFASLPRLTRSEAVAASLSARGLPGLSLARGLEALGRPLGQLPVVTPFALETWPAGSPFARPEGEHVAIVIGDALASGVQRLAIELDPTLAGHAIDRALGASAPEPRLAPGPVTDGERGTLAYLAALALQHAASFKVIGVVTTLPALAHALGPDAQGTMFAIPARVELGTVVGWARLWIPPSRAATAAEAALDPTLPITLALDAGIATLAARDVAALQIGDVVIPDGWTARPEGGRWRGELLAAAMHGGPRWLLAASDEVTLSRLEPAPAAATARIEGNTAMSTAAKSSVSEVPVELSVEIGRLALTAGELSALAPGAVVVTGIAAGSVVSLRSGSRVVARGELVVVDGELGIRIQSLG